MFNFFDNDTENKPEDAKGYRDFLLRAVKDELQKLEGGEGGHIRGINLFLAPGRDEQHIYESAVYIHEAGRFKAEVQRIADDFAIDLPADWALDIVFVDALPKEAKEIEGIDAALFIRTRESVLQRTSSAKISILSGEAEQEEYLIRSDGKKVTIGRERKAQMEDGFFRINTIAFPADSADEANKYISRQHAHIEWNSESSCFLLFADEGGVPPRNKVKIKSALNDELIKLNSIEIGHKLHDGDQIIIGETAVLEFYYVPDQQ
ncbi:FHA domain-containing protein [Pedobacter sp. SYSU D00535]|uniref:FHA domain-containing protein n=1 Tax=Pedobacter sp. SYSU D00535 TaxID=2810308 RepID=UPI001A95DE11|nr:FHA domain-containing protein [Pedobacter sp. SYSU D00535]